MLLACARVIAGHALAAREDHLRAPAEVANDRRDIAACFVGAIDLPDGLAGLAVKRDDIGVAVVIAVDDHHVLPQLWAATKSMHAGEAARRGIRVGDRLRLE